MQTKQKTAPQEYSPDWIQSLDGRCGITQEVKRRYQALTDDLGGAANLSYQQRAIVSRVLFVELSLQNQEADIAKGQEVDTGKYTQQVNSLVGLLKTLGLERKAKEVPDLASFLKSKVDAA